MSVLPRLLLPFALIAFVGLGASDGVFGTGWPSIRQDYGRSLGDLGVVIAVAIGGYVVMAAANGPLARMLPTGPRIALSYVAFGGGASLIAFGGSWTLLLLGALWIGLGDGILDPTINAHVARHHDMRAMNLLHATFGLGATVGPFLMLWAIERGGGWTRAYGVLVVWAMVMGFVALALGRAWPPAPDREEVRGRSVPTGVVGALAAFYLTTGVEVGVGVWAFSWLDDRGVSAGIAASLTALFWAGFTLSRLVGAVIGERFSPISFMRVAGVLLVAGLAWMTVDPAGTGGVGLPVAGAGVALVFPIIVAGTVRRFGDRGDDVVGWGFAASSLGAASLPWAFGQIAQRAGFDVAGPLLVGLAVVAMIVALRLTKSAMAPLGR